tara:strand:- start:51 stop:182 length:132 start_codon:yes stop_codon:yes gene_type:complete
VCVKQRKKIDARARVKLGGKKKARIKNLNKARHGGVDGIKRKT